jgi:hypothetical protein
VKSLFPRFLLLLACLHLTGGHWAALQGVAWVTMLVDHSREGSVVEAVSKTFDGQHPCPLCLAVADGQEEEREQKDSLIDLSAKWVATLVSEMPAAKMTSADLTYFPLTASEQSVSLLQPSPPPRVA